MNDGGLREAMASFHAPSGGSDVCPSAERLWRLAAGELGVRESREIVDHVSRCPACAEDLRLTRELVAETGADGTARADVRDPIPTVQSRPRSSSWSAGWVLAAALVLAIGAAFLLRSGPDDVMRRPSTEKEVHSLLADGEPLARGDARLRWSGLEGARYDVVVTTEDLQPVRDVRGLEDSELLLSEDDLARLANGTILLWQVDAALPDGSRVSSPSFRSRLVGDGE